MKPTIYQESIAEFVGAFMLVFFGCGSMMMADLSPGMNHVGVGIVWASVVAVMIYAFGHVSGAQYNPAVSLGFWLSGAQSGTKAITFIVTQIIAATLAALILRATFGDVGRIGATTPHPEIGVTVGPAFMLELVQTFALMIVILGSGLDKRAPAGFAGIAIGGTVGICALTFGPATNASMNPARSFGPAVASGVWTDHWIYWVATITGALLAVAVYRVVAPIAFPKVAERLTNAGAAGTPLEEVPA